MERKLGIFLSFDDVEDGIESLNIIKEQGFNTFFTLANKLEILTKIKEQADKLGLEYEFIHATWGGINELWTAEQTPQIFKDLIEQIDVCSAIGVKKLVVHLSSGNNAPMVNDLGFSRVDLLVSHAKNKGVLLAFENQRKLFNLACVLEKYKDEVGYCYDCGHENCFTKNIKFLDFWAEKITCVHIHDNDGERDQHLLPFEGTVDYDYVMKNLNRVNYSQSIMLEVPKYIYPDMTKKEFYFKAYESAKKLSMIK